MRIALLCLTLALLAACEQAPPTNASGPSAANTGMRYLKNGEDSGFTRAIEPRQFAFPDDHGAHPDFRSEWWYFTGNLFTQANRHFGFELTFFRVALAPRAESDGASAWRTSQVWLAHFAITDTARKRFRSSERSTRQALELAGAEAAPFHVWVEDWAVAAVDGDANVWRLSAADDETELALDLSVSGAPVAHGDNGLDRKGPEVGNASYYYSMPRISAAGSLRVGGEQFDLKGLVWLDREWSTSSLSDNVVGWDWFALRLSDESSLMFYRLRRADGSTSEFSGGTLVARDGRRVRLTADMVELEALDSWTSAASGVRYPVAWHLVVPSEAIDLTVRPYLSEQEIDLSVRYWEGAVQAVGQVKEGNVTAEGYVELAGY